MLSSNWVHTHRDLTHKCGFTSHRPSHPAPLSTVSQDIVVHEQLPDERALALLQSFVHLQFFISGALLSLADVSNQKPLPNGQHARQKQGPEDPPRGLRQRDMMQSI